MSAPIPDPKSKKPSSFQLCCDHFLNEGVFDFPARSIRAYESFENTGVLKASSIQGAYAKKRSTFMNKGDVSLKSFPHYYANVQNEGLMEIPSYKASPDTDSFLTCGKWTFQKFSIPDTLPSYTLEGKLEIGTLHYNGVLTNKGDVRVDDWDHLNASLMNAHLFRVLKKLGLKSLHNTSHLAGTGLWRVEEAFLNDGTFESWGDHTIKAKTLTNTREIVGNDPEHDLKLEMETFINGKAPSNSHLTPEQTKKSLASLRTSGRVKIQTQADLDNRWGTLYGAKGVSLISQTGSILNGAPLKSRQTKRTSPHSSHGPFDMWSEFFGGLYRQNVYLNGSWVRHGIGQRNPSYGMHDGGVTVAYDFLRSNGAFIASNKDLSLKAAHHIKNTFGLLFSKESMQGSAGLGVQIQGGLLRSEGKACLQTPLLEVIQATPHGHGLSYRPCPAWDCGTCSPTFSKLNFFETSDSSLLDVAGDLHLEVPKVKVEGSDVRTGGALLLNKGTFQGHLPADASLQVLVSPSGKGARIASMGAVFATTGHVAISGNVGGWSLHLDAQDLNLFYPHTSLPQALPTPQLIGPVTVNLNTWAQSKSHLLSSVNGTYCLPWEREEGENHLPLAFWGERTPPSRSLSLSPSLLNWAIRDAAFAVLGLEALDPAFLSRLSASGGRLGRSQTHTLTHSEEEREEDTQETSLIPLNTDLTQAISCLACQEREGCDTLDPILHLNPPLTLVGQLISEAATLWAPKELHTTTTGPTKLQGGQMVSLREEDPEQTLPPALHIKAKTLETLPVVETRGEDRGQTQVVYDVLVRKSKLLAIGDNAWIEAQDHQKHRAAELGAFNDCKVSTSNPQGEGIQYLPQILHAQTHLQIRQDNSDWWSDQTITTTCTSHQTTLEPTQVVSQKRDVISQTPSHVLQQASHISAGQKVLYSARHTQINAVPLVTSAKTTTEKEGTWSSSHSSLTLTQSCLYPATVQAGESVEWSGETALLEGAFIKAHSGLDHTRSFIAQEAKTFSEQTHDYSRSLTFRSDEVSQKRGEDVLEPSVLLFERKWKSEAYELESPGSVIFQGVKGRFGEGLFSKTFEIRDATQKNWALQSISSSGLLGGPFQAEPLANAIQGVRGSHHPMIQAASTLQLASTALGTIQDLTESTKALIKEDLLSACFQLLSRYTTLTFGTQNQSSHLGQTLPYRSNVTFGEFRMDTQNIPTTSLSVQGDVTVHKKAKIHTPRVTLLPSLTECAYEQSQESSTCGVNPLTMTASVGMNEAGGTKTSKTPTPTTFKTPYLELVTDRLENCGSEIYTDGGLLQIGECLIEGSLAELDEESWSSGFSFSVPLLPVAGGSLSALNLITGGVSGASFATSLATGWNVQTEERSRRIRKQVGTPGFYALNPDTGEMRSLEGQIDHLHTKGRTHQNLGNVKVLRHTHEDLPEIDDEDFSGFALPMGAITSLMRQGQWLADQFGSSSSSTLPPFAEKAEALKEKARDAILAKGATPIEADQALSLTHHLFEAGQQFQDTEPPAAPPSYEWIAQTHEQEINNLPTAERAQYIEERQAEIQHYQRIEAPREKAWLQTHENASSSSSLSEAGFGTRMLHNATGLLQEAAYIVGETANKNERLAEFVVMASQFALMGPAKFAQGLLADGILSETGTAVTQKFVQEVGRRLGFNTLTPSWQMEAAAGSLQMGLALVMAGPKSVIHAAKPVYNTLTRKGAAPSIVNVPSSSTAPSAYLDVATHTPKAGGVNKTTLTRRKTTVLTEDHLPSSSKIKPLGRPGFVEFDGVEFRAVRNLEHLNEIQLRDMYTMGRNPQDRVGSKLVGHHYQQQFHRESGSFIVETLKDSHSVTNTLQHPYGNQKGMGLTPAQRADWNKTRIAFNKERARNELIRRGLLEDKS